MKITWTYNEDLVVFGDLKPGDGFLFSTNDGIEPFMKLDTEMRVNGVKVPDSKTGSGLENTNSVSLLNGRVCNFIPETTVERVNMTLHVNRSLKQN